MAQEFASDNSKNGLFDRLKLSNHRGFFSFLFVSLSLILLLVTFAAVQQQQTTQSKAADCKENGALCSGSGSKCCSLYCNGTVCAEALITCTGGISEGSRCKSDTGATVGTCCSGTSCTNLNDGTKAAVCRKPPLAGGQGPSVGEIEYCSTFNSRPNGDIQCISSSDGKCTWDEARKCIPKTTELPGPGTGGGGGGDSACTSLGGRCLTGQTGREGEDCQNIAGQAGSGTIQSGLCSGGVDRKCCVPKSTTGGDVNCGALKTQATCIPADQCKWRIDANQCRKACSRITSQSNCTQYTGCEWVNSACRDKTGTDGTVCKENGTACSGSGSKCCSTYCNGSVCADTPGGDGGIITPPPGGTVTPPVGTGSADLNLKLSFQGIVTLPQTKTQLDVRVKLVDEQNTENEQTGVQFTADSNGVWSGTASFQNIDLGKKYYILTKGPKHLQKKICEANAADPQPGYYSCQAGSITLQSGSNDLNYSNVKLLVGDLDQNGVVDSLDTSVVFNALLLPVDQRQSSGVLESADLNLDGIVSTQDWGLVLEALKIKYDEK